MVEVLVTSGVDLELYGQGVYPASTVYTDGKAEKVMPAFFVPFYRGYESGSDQLVISGPVTYIAWTTENPSEKAYLQRDSKGEPFRHHLVTTKTMVELRRNLELKGKDIIKLVYSEYSPELRRIQYEE